MNFLLNRGYGRLFEQVGLKFLSNMGSSQLYLIFVNGKWNIFHYLSRFTVYLNCWNETLCKYWIILYNGHILNNCLCKNWYENQMANLNWNHTSYYITWLKYTLSLCIQKEKLLTKNILKTPVKQRDAFTSQLLLSSRLCAA